MSKLTERLIEEFKENYTPLTSVSNYVDDAGFYFGYLTFPHKYLDITLHLSEVIKKSNFEGVYKGKPKFEPFEQGIIEGVDNHELNFYIEKEKNHFELSDMPTEKDILKFKSYSDLFSYLKNLTNLKLSGLLDPITIDEEHKQNIEEMFREDAALFDEIQDEESMNNQRIFATLGDHERYKDKKIAAQDYLNYSFVRFARLKPGLADKFATTLNVGEVPSYLDTFDTVSFDLKSEIMNKNNMYDFMTFDTQLIVPYNISTDEIFLNSLADVAKKSEKRKFVDEIFTPRIFTDTIILDSSTKKLFAKQMNIIKVPYVDYELEAASQIRGKGLNAPEPIGILTIRKIPYVLFAYEENTVNLGGFDHTGKSNSLTALLHANEGKVFKELGSYIHKMFEKGVYDKDMARRNFLAKFNSKKEFEKIIQIDFEKTYVQKVPVAESKRSKLVTSIVGDLSNSEKNHFLKGYSIS